LESNKKQDLLALRKALEFIPGVLMEFALLIILGFPFDSFSGHSF
jgi:hypothetical protein